MQHIIGDANITTRRQVRWLRYDMTFHATVFIYFAIVSRAIPLQTRIWIQFLDPEKVTLLFVSSCRIISDHTECRTN